MKTKIPTKAELEKHLLNLQHEFSYADDGGKERIQREIRIVQTALLELAAKEQSELARKSEEQKEAQRRDAREFVQAATEYGNRIDAAIHSLISAFAGYRAMMKGAVEAHPSLKNAASDTLLNEREHLRAIAAAINHGGLKLPQGSFIGEQKPHADKVRLTERGLLGVIDGFSSLYEVAAEMEAGK